MEYLNIYKYSNKEELETIKSLLDLRKQPYIIFDDLVYKYTGEFNIDIEQIESFSKLYTECFNKNINHLMDNNIYLLVYSLDLNKIKIAVLTMVYSLNINREILNNDLPF